MFRSHQFIATCFALIVLGSTAAAAPEPRHAQNAFEVTAATPAKSGDAVEITDLQPFTHVAYIPFGADLSSVKIEGIEMVKVATKRRSVTNAAYYEQPWSEPGVRCTVSASRTNRMYPPTGSRYSYRGQSMASDEYGNTYFTFRVYYRPDEISPDLRRAASSGRIGWSASAEFLRLTTSRESIQQVVIDRASSTLCDGSYVDGNWIHTNPKCEEQNRLYEDYERFPLHNGESRPSLLSIRKGRSRERALAEVDTIHSPASHDAGLYSIIEEIKLWLVFVRPRNFSLQS